MPYTAPGIQQIALERLVQKRLVVVGAVKIDEQPAQLPQRLHCRRSVIHENAPASGGGDDAPDNQHSSFAWWKPRRAEYGANRLRNAVKLSFNARLARAVANRGGVGARAERKFQRSHQHRLAGAGFAGNHIEPRAERCFDMFDDREIVY